MDTSCSLRTRLQYLFDLTISDKTLKSSSDNACEPPGFSEREKCLQSNSGCGREYSARFDLGFTGHQPGGQGETRAIKGSGQGKFFS